MTCIGFYKTQKLMLVRIANINFWVFSYGDKRRN